MRPGLAAIVACGCLSKPSPPGTDSSSCDGLTFEAPVAVHGSAFDGKSPDDPTLDHGGTEIWFSYTSASAGYELVHAVASAGSFDTVTDIGALLSAADESDPSLTADGLDLMFQSQESGSQVMETTRDNRNMDFAVPAHGVVLDAEPVESGGIELSADGLTLYYVDAQYSLYAVTRSSRTEPFGMPSEPLALGIRFPSLSADQREIFFTKPNDSGVYRRIRDTVSDTFDTAHEDVILSTGFDPDLTSDGKTLVMSVSGGLVMATRSCP